MTRLIFSITLYISIVYSSIDDDIEAIGKAPIEERFKLMNRLKDKIAKMQEENRLKSINRLKAVTNGELITIDNNSSRLKTHIENSISDYTNLSIGDMEQDD